MIHFKNMAKENIVLITDCVIISNAAPVACLFVCLFFKLFLLINPLTYTQSHTPTLVQGGGGGLMESILSPVGRPRAKIKPIFERPLTSAPSVHVAAWRFNCALKKWFQLT